MADSLFMCPNENGTKAKTGSSQFIIQNSSTFVFIVVHTNILKAFIPEDVVRSWRSFVNSNEYINGKQRTLR